MFKQVVRGLAYRALRMFPSDNILIVGNDDRFGRNADEMARCDHAENADQAGNDVDKPCSDGIELGEDRESQYVVISGLERYSMRDLDVAYGAESRYSESAGVLGEAGSDSPMYVDRHGHGHGHEEDMGSSDSRSPLDMLQPSFRAERDDESPSLGGSAESIAESSASIDDPQLWNAACRCAAASRAPDCVEWVLAAAYCALCPELVAGGLRRSKAQAQAQAQAGKVGRVGAGASDMLASARASPPATVSVSPADLHNLGDESLRAAMQCPSALARRLLSSRSSCGITGLHVAAANNDAVMCELFIARGVPVDPVAG